LWSSAQVVEQKMQCVIIEIKYDIVVSLNSENCMKMAKLAKDFIIPTTTLTAV